MATDPTASNPPTFYLGIPARQSAADLSIGSLAPSMVTDQKWSKEMIAVGGLGVLSGTIPHSPSDAGDFSQQAMFQDIDATLTRLENGIAAERTAMDGLLDRLTGKAA